MNNKPNNISSQPTPGSAMMTGILVGTVILLIVISMLVSSLRKYNNSPEEASSPSEIKQPEPTYRKISAQDLCAYYDSNGVAADAMFKDQIIEVTGVVNRVDSMLGVPFVCLDTGNLIRDVQCCFTSGNEAQLLSLQKGQKVTIRGVCKGKAVFNIVLRDCSILSP
jgi:hypothetical protein